MKQLFELSEIWFIQRNKENEYQNTFKDTVGEVDKILDNLIHALYKPTKFDHHWKKLVKAKEDIHDYDDSEVSYKR